MQRGRQLEYSPAQSAKMKSTAAYFATLAVLFPLALAQSAEWGQCGGEGWTGPTTCVAGTTCVYSNPWYSQCLPGVSIMCNFIFYLGQLTVAFVTAVGFCSASPYVPDSASPDLAHFDSSQYSHWRCRWFERSGEGCWQGVLRFGH